MLVFYLIYFCVVIKCETYLSTCFLTVPVSEERDANLTSTAFSFMHPIVKCKRIYRMRMKEKLMFEIF